MASVQGWLCLESIQAGLESFKRMEQDSFFMQPAGKNMRLANWPAIRFSCKCMSKVSMFRTLTVWTTEIRFNPLDRRIPSRSAGGRHHAQHCSHLILNLKRHLVQSMSIGFDAVLWPTTFQTSPSEHATLNAVFVTRAGIERAAV